MAQNSMTKSPAVNPPSSPQTPGAAREPDFVLKDLQGSADDAVRLAYGSMTLPPRQFLDLFSKVGEEYVNFVARRMQAQAERVQCLSRCTNLEDIAKSEMAFFGKATEDYVEQFERLAAATHGAAVQAEESNTKS